MNSRAGGEQFQATRLRLAHLLADSDQYDEAIELLKLYTRDLPEDVAARLFFIDCLSRKGEREWAAGEYVNLADDLAGRGEIDQALDVYRKAQSLAAEGVDVSLHIIQLLQSAGRKEEAVAECLAQSKARLEAADPEGALATLQSAVEIDPAREDLYVRMAEIVAEARLGGAFFSRLCEGIEGLFARPGPRTRWSGARCLGEGFPGPSLGFGPARRPGGCARQSRPGLGPAIAVHRPISAAQHARGSPGRFGKGHCRADG